MLTPRRADSFRSFASTSSGNLIVVRFMICQHTVYEFAGLPIARFPGSSLPEGQNNKRPGSDALPRQHAARPIEFLAEVALFAERTVMMLQEPRPAPGVPCLHYPDKAIVLGRPVDHACQAGRHLRFEADGLRVTIADVSESTD